MLADRDEHSIHASRSKSFQVDRDELETKILKHAGHHSVLVQFDHEPDLVLRHFDSRQFTVVQSHAEFTTILFDATNPPLVQSAANAPG